MIDQPTPQSTICYLRALLKKTLPELQWKTERLSWQENPDAETIADIEANEQLIAEVKAAIASTAKGGN